MNLLAKIFKREPVTIEELRASPDDVQDPQSVADYLRRGWAYHARDQEDLAEQDFRAALAIDSKSVDAYYGLGMTLKAQGRSDPAVEAFKKALELLENGAVDDRTRAEMLHRLSVAHVNELTRGDWHLETEIWRRRT